MPWDLNLSIPSGTFARGWEYVFSCSTAAQFRRLFTTTLSLTAHQTNG
jgi:hypothetical protein